MENVSGKSAVVCWSRSKFKNNIFKNLNTSMSFYQVESTANKNIIPDNYKLYIWNSKEQARNEATVVQIPSKTF